MKQTLSTSQATHLLMEDTGKTWSYQGARLLVEYLEQMEEDTGEEIEMDVVAIRCDFSEHASLQDWADDYFGAGDWQRSMDLVGCDDEQMDETIREYIRDHGTLLEGDSCVVVSSF